MPRFRIKKAFLLTSSVLSLLASSWRMVALCLATTSRRSPLSTWCYSLSSVLVSCGHISFPTLTISVHYFNQNCSKWFLPHNVYAYFLCGLMCRWIHESDAELICMRFFLDVLTYSDIVLCFRLLYAIVLSSDVFDDRARARVCVCVVHWHCTAQLSMFNMEKRFRNKIIIIIITVTGCPVLVYCVLSLAVLC